MRTSLLISFLLMAFSLTAIAQGPPVTWQNTLGDPMFIQSFNDIIQTDDGGFIAVGKSGVSSVNQIWVVKTDADGNTVSEWFYGGQEDDIGSSIEQTTDGGYIIGGIAEISGEDNAIILKISASGDSLWSVTYDYMESEDISVIQTSDGGYVGIGGYGSMTYGTDIFMAKLDADGNQEWDVTFDFGSSERASFISEHPSGGYVASGYAYAGSEYKALIFKTDANGNVEWQELHDGPSTAILIQIWGGAVAVDGSYYLAGEATLPDYTSDMLLLKIDGSGSLEWMEQVDIFPSEQTYSVDGTEDGGCVVGGHCCATSWPDPIESTIRKFTSEGDMEWYGTYQHEADKSAALWSVVQTTDGDYVFAGHSAPNWGDNLLGMITRVGSEPSTSDLTIALTPVGLPIQIPVNGGSFDFNIAVENSGSTAETVDIWTMVTLPNGSEYGPIIDFQDFVLNPGANPNRDRIQAVPASAPVGIYTYDAYIGTYPDLVLDEDHFDFEKLAAADGAGTVSDWSNWGEDFNSMSGESSVLCSQYSVLSCYPNPFNPCTEIRFGLQEAGNIKLVVYDVLGREIATLADGYHPAGINTIIFNADGLSSGIYFYSIEANGFRDVKKMMLVK